VLRANLPLCEGGVVRSPTVARTKLAADTFSMTKKPEPPEPIRWEIFKIAKKSVWVGNVEARDAATAVQKAAEEFKIDVRRLYARRR
jgi:hypothetical protein